MEGEKYIVTMQHGEPVSGWPSGLAIGLAKTFGCRVFMLIEMVEGIWRLVIQLIPYPGRSLDYNTETRLEKVLNPSSLSWPIYSVTAL